MPRTPYPSEARPSSTARAPRPRKKGPSRGEDAGKKVKGRKRHLVVDILGMTIGVVVHGADVQDRDGARPLIRKIRFQCPRLRKVWADGGYAGQLEAWVTQFTGWKLEIVRRRDEAAGFNVLPKRWIVERTFAWLSRYRRLAKDYEFFAQTAENMIYLAMINLMLHRLAPEARNDNYLPRNQAAAA
ncbi:MAG: IS5 family transposase [bacterium]|nr:IS5 family transposase [bacterium]